MGDNASDTVGGELCTPSKIYVLPYNTIKGYVF
jgi:hypothetical protein